METDKGLVVTKGERGGGQRRVKGSQAQRQREACLGMGNAQRNVQMTDH